MPAFPSSLSLQGSSQSPWEACVLSWIRPGLDTGCSFKHFQKRASWRKARLSQLIHVQKVGTHFFSVDWGFTASQCKERGSLSVQNCGLVQNKAALQDV